MGKIRENFHKIAPAYYILACLLAIELGLQGAHHLKQKLGSFNTAARAAEVTTTIPSNGFKSPSVHPATVAKTLFGPTDSFPFRSEIVTPEKAAEADLSIWIASASHGKDTNYPPEVIFPNNICSLLSSSTKKCIVLNASSSGTGVQGNLDTFTADYGTWKPKYVLLYQMSIDLIDLSGVYLGNGIVDSGSKSNRAAHDTPFTQRINAYLNRYFQNTFIYRDAREFIGSTTLLSAPLANGLPAAANHEFREMLEHFVTTVRKEGATPVLCTFAASFNLSNENSMNYRTRTWMLFWDEYLSPHGWLQTIATWNNIIRSVAKQRGLPLVDLAKQIGGHPYLFKDPVHFTEEGHLAVARAIVASGAFETETMESVR